MAIDGYSAALDVGAALEKRINEVIARVAALEDEMQAAHARMDQQREHMARLSERGDSEGVITLRITAERGW